MNKEELEQLWELEYIKLIKNEEEINNFEIFLNDNIIDFNYDDNFQKEGN